MTSRPAAPVSERLRDDLMKYLDYDPQTGIFKWKIARAQITAGSKAGTHLKGYRRIRFFGKDYHCGRLAWLFMTGSWPRKQIDHKNGIRDDNRFTNLREVTGGENLQNITKVRGSCGLLGVSKSRNGKRFAAWIMVKRKNHYLGTFDTAEAAHAAYLTAKRILHPAAIFR